MPLSAITPDRYDELLSQKLAKIQPMLAPFFSGDPAVYASAPTGFRMRAEFRIWHEGDRLDYVMFRRGEPRQPITVAHFPIACPQIQQLMPAVRERLTGNHELRHKLFQIEFLSTLAGDTAVTLIYHRPLTEAWDEAATNLAASLDISVIGRSRKQKRVIEKDWVNEVLHCRGVAYHYRQPEQAFTQPNARINEQMLEWALDQTENQTGDLLELYCGIGNFTLPLAQQFERVIATELSKVATRAAEFNQQRNGIGNIEFVRMSAEDMTDAMDGKRAFRRLAHLNHPLADYDLRTLLVDPPRAGLDPATLALAGRFETIVYISCNPQTLCENLAQLSASHEVAALAFFDQFPYTTHMECGVRLTRR